VGFFGLKMRIPQKRITFDTETALISDENPIPMLTCLSWCVDGKSWGLVDHAEACSLFIGWLLDDDVYLVGHNIAFDVQVMVFEIQNRFTLSLLWADRIWGLVFAKYDKNLILDTLLIEKIKAIETGKLTKSGQQMYRGAAFKFSLAACFKKHTGEDLEGKSTVRLGYGKLRGVPLDQWSELERAYALNDALATDHIYQLNCPDGYENPYLWAATARGALGLHITSTNGFAVDGDALKILDEEITTLYLNLQKEILAHGFLKKTKKKGLPHLSRDLKKIKAAVSQAFGGNPPLTDKGGVKTDAETLKIASEKSPALAKVSEYVSLEKLKSTYIEALKKGVDFDIHAYFNPLVGTYRTSCGRPNLQNMPRKEGIRQCFVPRDGFIFCSCDYDTLELRTLAQACIDLVGFSKMGDAQNEGIDPHLQMAAQVLQIDYSEALLMKKKGDPKIKEARQLAKAANFGYPGGAGAESFRKIAKNYGIEMTKNQAQDLKQTWFNAWPEMKLYFDHVGVVCQSGSGFPTIERVGATRGDVFFTEACNFYFQGLAAIGAKEALYQVVQACLSEESILFGCKVVNFIHDEVIVEVPEAAKEADACAREISRIMCDEMQKLVPDVKIGAAPALMLRWEKGAEPVFNDEGLLIPWESM